MSYEPYGINFLSLAVCGGEEYAVNDKRFFLPGRLETFKWEWPECAWTKGKGRKKSYNRRTERIERC
jgi:hypothetical protein